jgi:hypothetical protein
VEGRARADQLHAEGEVGRARAGLHLVQQARLGRRHRGYLAAAEQQPARGQGLAQRGLGRAPVGGPGGSESPARGAHGTDVEEKWSSLLSNILMLGAREPRSCELRWRRRLAAAATSASEASPTSSSESFLGSAAAGLAMGACEACGRGVGARARGPQTNSKQPPATKRTFSFSFISLTARSSWSRPSTVSWTTSPLEMEEMMASMESASGAGMMIGGEGGLLAQKCSACPGWICCSCCCCCCCCMPR